MTTSELWKGVSLRLITAAVFGAIGYFAIYYALQMVAIFGEGMGVDARSREIYGESHRIIHVFAAACALAIGVFHYAGNKLLRGLAVLAILTCGGYGIVNMAGFASVNRVSVAAAKDAKNAGAERQYQSARADLAKQIDWLQKTASQEEGRERKRLLAEVDAKRKELSALKVPVPTADTVLADPQAVTFERITGGLITAETWKYALPIPLAILMFFAEAFSFVVVGHMLSGAVALLVASVGVGRTSEPPKTQDGSGGSGGGEPRKLKVVQSEPPKPAAARTAQVASPDKDDKKDKVSSAGMRFLPGLPTGKLSAFDLAYEAFNSNPHASTRQVAKRAGVSQSTAMRVKKRQLGKVDSIIRRYGNGGGYHPAYN